ILAPATYMAPTPWAPSCPLRDWFLSRVLELTFTAWDLEPFARDCGHAGPPFTWNRERRRILRADIDAAFFSLYGIHREDVMHIMSTFSVVRKNDEREYGEYLTGRLVLTAYDQLSEAIRTGRPYHSPLKG